jgi:calcium/calmodulin-dependent protein kinase I
LIHPYFELKMIRAEDAQSIELSEPGTSLTGSLGLEVRFDLLYVTDQRLRSGSFGTVFTCRHKLYPEKTYAVKIIDRKKLEKHDDDNVFREVSVMKELSDVPTVVRLIDFFVEPEKLYMVQVYAEGGDVFDRLAKRTCYNEKDAQELAETLLNTINALHERNIAHRDLKPENLLLLGVGDDASILLADFGFARHTTPENLCKTRCGTPGR